MTTLRRRLLWLVRVATGILLLTLILSRMDRVPLASLPPGRVVWAILSATALLFLGQALAAARWRVVIGPGAPPWPYLLRLYLIGNGLSLFLPTLVGGDGFRAVAATRAGLAAPRAVSSVLLDRGLGMLALAAYGVAGLSLAPSVVLHRAGTMVSGVSFPAVLLPGILALGLLAWVLVRSAALATVRSRVRTALEGLTPDRRRTVAAFGLGLLVQAVYVLLWMTTGAIIGLSLPALSYLITVPFITAAGMLPVTLAGLGVREAAWLFLLQDYAFPSDLVVGFSLLYFAAHLLVGGLGALTLVAFGTTPPRPER